MAEENILNKEQKTAVETISGPVLVVAGAGAGKTKVITERIKYLIEIRGISPEKILAVTFTNKAAGEMKTRVGGTKGAGPFIGTFHALGLMMIKENIKKLGLDARPAVVDSDDSLKLIKESLVEIGKDPKQYDPSRVKNQISNFKNRLITLQKFLDGISEDGDAGSFGKILGQVWEIYEKKLKEQNFLDFDDLLLKPALLLENNSESKKEYQKRWQYIHIDEYQDTNEAQYTLSKILAGEHGNILAVGDVDQAIYSWRGADFRNVLNFQKDYPDAKVITLEKNYRSTDIILESANALILNNKMRLPKNLWTEKKGNNKITIFFAEDERKEAEFAVKEIKMLHGAGVRYKDMAILYRTNAQSRSLEETFLKRSVPYRIIGGVRFYERKEIKDILAYVRLAVNEKDEISKKRILNVPPRGIGKTLTLKIFGGEVLRPEEEKKYGAFKKLIGELRSDAREFNLHEFLRQVIKKIGYREYVDDGTEKGLERWQNAGELLSIAKKISNGGGNVEDFLEHVSLFSVDDLPAQAGLPDRQAGRADDDPEKRDEKVSLMTMHTAKGLEFEAVFAVGLEEGLFPHTLSFEKEDLEEERRLCYVAITRAKTHLYLTHSLRRTLFGERVSNLPSRFLSELPEHLIESTGNPYREEEGVLDESIIEY
ncbi:MAG: ATP-dependent DNA helicase PcrA [Candidatus Giovannonibacteria bacterium GW2011_GWA2_44_13b]|uniref:DNA 3'-5' helicase n=1 Tax=Candidatus Giovannonibacteria bacterium GW2011_GWA2_44_13b TaxID=1618647 RepID=A0A0G1K213_9BACT|nr:MAG: ATP-dependent DNA helicase PcrA [Candidatus Giovannonibacteria bacterium GW2011_GWA2_44_13b]